MPFDFLSKHKSKDKGAADSARPTSKTRDLVGGIEGFDAQAKALAPAEDKGKSPLDALKGGHPLKALKQAFGKGDRQPQPVDAATVAKVDAVWEASSQTRAIGNSIVTLLGMVQLEAKEGGHDMDRAPEMLARVAVARRAAGKLVAADTKVHAAAMDWQRHGGSLVKFQACVMNLLAAAQEVHMALYGHAGPEDHKTAEGILYNPVNPDDKLVGGRSKTSDEARQKGLGDTRTGAAGEYKYPRLPEQLTTPGKVSLGRGVYQKAGIWVDCYKNLADAIANLGVML